MVNREPIRSPELTELETFVLAVDEGSIARAAERLGISPPAAAKRIQQLESLSIEPLLERGHRGVRPTEAGARLYPVALDLLADRARAVDSLTNGGSADPLRISGMRQVIGRVDARSAEELFRQTEALLTALFHASHESVFITQAADGLVCEINDAAVKLTGYEQDEVRGRRLEELDLWEDVSRRDELVQRTLATGRSQDGELVVLTKSGQRCPVRARFQAIELHRIMYLLLMIQVLAG